MAFLDGIGWRLDLSVVGAGVFDEGLHVEGFEAGSGELYHVLATLALVSAGLW